MPVEYIKGHEIEELVGQFAGAMEELERQARDAELRDIALAAGDASAALFVLLDTWVRERKDRISFQHI